YWSRDSSGQSVISLEEQKEMGLPGITVDEELTFQHWSEEAYDCLRKYQELRGFDPSTTDFARSLGLPILDVI
ncbi:hypothetical protein L218DRAFT_842153, partial [Marasmius fiardii PR-910]